MFGATRRNDPILFEDSATFRPVVAVEGPDGRVIRLRNPGLGGTT